MRGSGLKNSNIYTPDTKIGYTNALKEKLRVLKAEKQELELISRRAFVLSDPNNIKLPEIYPAEPAIDFSNPTNPPPFSLVVPNYEEHKEDCKEEDQEEKEEDCLIQQVEQQPTKKYPNINDLLKTKKW